MAREHPWRLGQNQYRAASLSHTTSADLVTHSIKRQLQRENAPSAYRLEDESEPLQGGAERQRILRDGWLVLIEREAKVGL